MAEIALRVDEDDNDQLKVTFPHSEDRIIFGPFKRDPLKKVTIHEFHLEEDLHSALLRRSDLDLQFKRCYGVEDLSSAWWPQGLNVNVNKTPMTIEKDEYGHSGKPLYLKTVCRRRNVIQITGNTLDYMFVVRLVHRYSVPSVIDIHLKKRLLPPSDCVTKLNQNFETLGDEQTNIIVSLKCPMSKRRITVPARGDDCDHIQCFELESYLKYVAEKGYFWIYCPVCNLPVSLDLLEVDQFMREILTSLESTETEEIVIDRNAQWSPVPLKLDRQEGDNNELPFQAAIPQEEANRIKSAASDALKYGEKKNNRISLLFIGQDRVGKTSLKKTLLGEETQQYQESTIGIDYEVVEVNESGKSKPWKRSADAQFIASEKYANDVIAREAARKIHEPRNTRGWEIPAGGKRGEHGIGDRKRESGNEGEDEDEARRGTDNEDDLRSEKDGGGKDDERESNTQRSTEYQYEYPISRDLIKKAQKKVENYRDDTFDTIRFMVGDVAGQSVLYDVHSLMLRLRTIFVHVLDLTKDLDAEAKPKFMEKGEKKETELGNPMRETNLDYFTKWTAALYNLNPLTESKEKPVESLNRPKTIIAFTKSDQLSDEAAVKLKRDQAMDALDKRFRRTGYNPLIIGSYVIRNTKPRNDEEAREIESLREKIFQTAQELLKEQEKTPVNWLILERLLDNKRLEATKRDCPYITLDEVKKLGKQCKVEESFNEAMKFFHEENIVVHFQGNSPLNELVVLDPAWLVHLFTAVIGVSRRSSCPLIELCAWSDLQKGKLDFDKLPTALDKHRGSRKALQEMMVRARLICHWRGNVYLVPSMVNERFEEKEIDELLSKCRKPTLFLDFADKSIPLGFHTRFLVEIMKWANIGHLECASEELQLFCNLMRVEKNENGLTYSVVVVRHISRIEFAILVPGQTIEWTNIARSVLSALDDIVRNIRSTHPSFKGMRYKFGLKCDLCCDKTNEPCERHNVKACSHGDCVHIWDLKSLKKPLFGCKNNMLGLDVSRLHVSTWVKATGNVQKYGHNGEARGSCPADDEKLTEREQTRLATYLGSFWMQLLGLLNIVHETKENILRNAHDYPDIESQAKQVLHIYSERRDFSRKELAKLVQQDLQLFDEAKAIISGKYQTLEEKKDIKIFEAVKGEESEKNEADFHGSPQTINVPADKEKLSEREQTRLAKHLNPRWSELLGLLNIDHFIRDNLSNSVHHYPDNISKAKEVLHIYTKRGDFSRKNLAELVKKDLELFDEAEAILSGKWKSI